MKEIDTQKDFAVIQQVSKRGADNSNIILRVSPRQIRPVLENYQKETAKAADKPDPKEDRRDE